MEKKMNLIVIAPSEGIAREKIIEWYGDRKNLKIASVTPSPNYGGYQVSFSYDMEDRPL